MELKKWFITRENWNIDSKGHKIAIYVRNYVGVWGFMAAIIALMAFNKIVLSFFIAIVCSWIFWLTTLFYKGPEIHETDSLLHKIKKRLQVEHVTVKIRKKQMKKVAFGGFAVPLLPFYVSIGWNDAVDKTEAMIHELVHDHYFIYGYQTAVMYVTLMFVMVGVVLKTPLSILGAILVPLGFMLFQEYLAFTYTHRVAAEFGIDVREWSYKIFTKYLIYYTCWIGFIASVMYIGNTFGFIPGIAYLVVGFIAVQKGFYLFGVWFNKHFPDKKNARFLSESAKALLIERDAKFFPREDKTENT